MRKFLLFVLVVLQTGTASALTKNDVLSVQNGIYYLDGAPFAEIGWNKFEINWLLFDEVYAGRLLTNTNDMVIKQRNSIRELAESGVKTIRIFGNVYTSNFSKWLFYFNQSDPILHERCWLSLDKTLDICEENNIRAVVSLACENFEDRTTTPAENQRELIGNPNSASRALLYRYLNEAITRYKDRKGVLAWEVGNELTLKPDIDPGTRVRDGERKPTLAQLSQFYKEVVQKIKSIDTLRMVTSGGSILREMAYGLSIIPQTDKVTNWPAKRDTYSQQLNAYRLVYDNSGFENIDIHFYLKKAPNYQILADDATTPLIMDEIRYNALSTALGKPLMIGEYGVVPKVRTDPDYWLTGQDWFETFTGESDSAQMYVQEACDRAVNSGCRLIYWWCYDSHRLKDQTDSQRFDLDIVRTPILFKKVLDANRRLKLKYNITSATTANYKERKMWYKGGYLFLSPDLIGKTCRVYNVHGVLLQQFVSTNSVALKNKGILIIKAEDKIIKILNN